MPELPLRNSAILLRSLGAAGLAGLQSLYLRSLLQEEPAVPAHRPIPGGCGVVCIAVNTACLDGAGFSSGLGCWDGETRQVDRCVMVHLYVQRRGMWSKVQILWPDCRLAQMLVLAMLLSE